MLKRFFLNKNIYHHADYFGLLENNVAVKQRIKLSLGLCVAVIAFVALKPASAAIWECGERSNLPPEGKNYCAAGDFRQSELNMKKILDVLLAKHKEAFGDISALSNSQSAFESYRDNQCVSCLLYTSPSPRDRG